MPIVAIMYVHEFWSAILIYGALLAIEWAYYSTLRNHPCGSSSSSAS